jgi:phosphoribosylformylglycinamidine cyclo-ligase
MSESASSYRDAGVDIDQANLAKRRIRLLARRTFTRGVLADIGGFGGLFRLPVSGFSQPVLVASVDGVGTKLKLAFSTGIHHTVGKDLVAHCVNDILVQGAAPLFFMDYIATGRMVPGVIAKVVKGVAEGCREAGCALLGGETAEMPGFYPEGEYDLAGFIVGVVEKSRVINGRGIRPGDLILGLPSAGLHTNGYSLARKILLETNNHTINSRLPELNQTLGKALLAPHLNYAKILRPLINQNLIQGMAHITGGGLTENIPRVLQRHCQACIRIGSWPILPIFQLLQRLGHIEQTEMFRVFNMGVGMALIVAPGDLARIRRHFNRSGQVCYPIGAIRSGKSQVIYEC